jgi:2-oxoglutarate ferredoxin oxidoreductase subunit alpha
VPTLASFGRGFRYHITGLFHDRAGFPTERTDEIDAWLTRAFAKLDRGTPDLLRFEEDVEDDPQALLVAYGVTARSAQRAMALARQEGMRVSLFRPITLWPFPEEALLSAAHMVERIIVVEMNMGQLALEVERILGRERVRRVSREDGELIAPGHLLRALREP